MTAQLSTSTFADCWFLTGPTASGKTEVGLALAERLGAEIVSSDSMALYRHLDIGTAKPTATERRRVPHHLLDLVEPHQDYSLANYLEQAAAAVDQIKSRGRQVLFVGGTPLYTKSLLRGIFQGPAADWKLRGELLAAAQSEGPGSLHRRLLAVDPISASRLHPNDTRRLVRALEVFALTGQPISHWQQQFERGRAAHECRVFCLIWPRDQLHQRIDARVDAMFAAGLVDEVRTLLTRPPVAIRRPPSEEHNNADAALSDSQPSVASPPGVFGHHALSRTARQALGYREVLDYLAGQQNLEETIALVKTRTRQFAKRQMTWYRSLSECRNILINNALRTEEAVDCICRLAATGQTEARLGDAMPTSDPMAS